MQDVMCMDKLMRKPAILSLLAVTFLFGSCAREKESEREYTFSEIIELRMKNDQTIDDATLLIKSDIEAYFDIQGCADDAVPCTDEYFIEDDGIPTYQSTRVGPCASDGFMLIEGSEKEDGKSEILHIENISDFDISNIASQSLNNLTFHALVEYVERTPFCSSQMNYGIKLTLKEGDETGFLGVF